MRADNQLKVRLPMDVKAFLAAEAGRNGSSQNSEVIRALRERMDRAKTAAGLSPRQANPAVAPNEPVPAGSSTTA